MFGFALKIYGCQMNVYDGDRIASEFLARGWKEVAEEEADVVVYVTCSIRDKAEQKVRSELGRHAPKGEGRHRLVAVVGCMAQRVGRELLSRFPQVRVVCGPRHLGRLAEAVEASLRGGETAVLLDDDPRALDDLERVPTRRLLPFKSYVTIAHGCDNFCTYCIVPHVRGRFQSRRPEAIVDEVRALVDGGVVEVTLLGQNVNSYGTDLEGISFAGLLRSLSAVKGLRRLRFATNHPKDLTGEVIAALAEESVVCPAVNLPIQSGSDRVLHLMNRGYDVAAYADRIGSLRAALPEVAVTSDLIVAFPGETEEDFSLSMEALRRFRFDQVHSAAYSPRPGTAAAAFDGAVPAVEARRRINAVNDLQLDIAREINEALVGRTFELLVEGPAPRGEGLLQGRTRTDKVVLFPGRGLEGCFVDVVVESSDAWSLRGRLSGEGS